MITTDYGSFDGDSWEDVCQVCLMKKYEERGYQKVVAHSNGDMGIEGYTRDGIVFQCYCPDKEYSADELYDKQRDKINTDLNKLILNQKELKKYLGEAKIKKWLFLTPYYLKKDILKYCVKKREEYRKINCDILDPEFDVLVYDTQFIEEYIVNALIIQKKKIEGLKYKIDIADIEGFKSSNVSLVDNLNRKVKIMISNKNKCAAYINNQIKHNIVGNKEMERLESRFNIIYEKVYGILVNFEEEIEDRCLNSPVDLEANELLLDLERELKDKLKEELGESVDSNLIDTIKRHAVADWLMRCPFEVEWEDDEVECKRKID